MLHYTRINWQRLREEIELSGKYDQTIYTFDTESSNGFIWPDQPDKVAAFDYSLDPEAYKKAEKVSICYLWQFGINDTFYYGRYIEEFFKVLAKLEELPGRKIIWVHNLSWDQNFLENIFHPSKLFARKAHSIIYMDFSEKVRFRCTFQLTHLSLAAWGKQIGRAEKIMGYNYDKIRHPESYLSQKELEYGEQDLRVILEGIRWYLKEYKHIQKIPMTMTGGIRKKELDLFEDDIGYKYKMARLLPDADMHIIERMSFSGGNVHANWYYAGILLHGVRCADIASSYPFCCCTELLPMTPWREARDYKYYLGNPKFCCLLEVRFHDLRARMHIDYISYSKIYNEVGHPKNHDDMIIENGRMNYIRQADMVITNIDYEIIREAYDGEIEILRCWYSRAGRLDKRLVEFILDHYENKTKLKGVEGAEDLYMQSKGIINGVYGDFASSLVYSDTILEDDGTWSEIVKGLDDMQEAIDKIKARPYRLKSRYVWGSFITAAARRNHFQILKTLDKDNDIAYYDTDSVYYLGDHQKDIIAYNKMMVQRIDEAMADLGIDPERTRPKDPKGKKRQMGILEMEYGGKPLQEFKAIRAKCYGYRDANGQLHITISGVNKNKGIKALHDDLDRLDDNLVFHYDEAGRKISTYRIDQPVCIWEDEDGKRFRSFYRYGVNLMPSWYHLKLQDDFFEVLACLGAMSSDLSRKGIDELAELVRLKD